MASFPTNVGPGLFVPITDTFDFNRLGNVDINSPEFRTFITRLTNRINDISVALNLKDTGMYPLTEFVNGQTWFPNPSLNSTTAQAPTQRQVFRKTFNTGALPNAGTKTIAHGIAPTALYTFTRIYGAASDTTNLVYIPLPFVDVSGTIAAGMTELSVDGTNIYITTTGNGTNFNVSYVVLEYLKN